MINRVRSFLKNLNRVLPELLIGIVILGILEEIPVLFLMKDRLNGSIGLWIGVVIAIGMAVHMAWFLERVVTGNEGEAQKQMQLGSTIRYFVVVILLGIVMVTRIGNPLLSFLGVMNLKVAAYLQPFTHKVITRVYGKEEHSS